MFNQLDLKNMKQQILHYINKFSEIPDEQWLVDRFYENRNTNYKLLGVQIPFIKKEITVCCAQGHCVDKRKLTEFCSDVAFLGYHRAIKLYPEVSELYNITQSPEDGQQVTIGLVNNGAHPDYQQATPKARVIAYLYDLLSKEYDKEFPFSEEHYAKFKED